MPSPRAVLFDLDGTLIDSLNVIFRCLDETSREIVGQPFPRAVWEKKIGIPLSDTFALLGELGIRHNDQLVANYRDRQVGLFRELAAFPGVPETLSTLRERGVSLAIVTTKLRGVAELHLTTTGIRDCFEVVIGFDDCERAKPDPQPFQIAMERLGVRPEECIAVGDTPHDIHGGRAAGALTCGAFWGTLAHEMLRGSKPDHHLEHPSEILSLIR